MNRTTRLLGARAVVASAMTTALLMSAAPAGSAPLADVGGRRPAASKAAPSVPARSAAVAAVRWTECPTEWGGFTNEDMKEMPELKLRFSCSTVAVPLDHDDPAAGTVKLALKRVAATNPSKRIGTLFINPGGPGGSGVEFADFAWAMYPQAVRERFDIVGFDPRGIGLSNGLTCFDSFQQAGRVLGGAEMFPITADEEEAIKTANATLAQQCHVKGGPLTAHLSTANVARDLDLLRQAVGDPQLTFAGYSYGTQIANTYAAMFPQNVRALVLDAVIDPERWANLGGAIPASTRTGSHLGSQATFEQFLTQCRKAGPDRCALAHNLFPGRVVNRLLDRLKERPLRLKVSNITLEFTYQSMIGGINGLLYDPATWQDDAAVIALLADQAGIADFPDRPSKGRARLAGISSIAGLSRLAEVPMASLGEGAMGVLCEDSDSPRGHDAWVAAAAQAEMESRFGALWTYNDHVCGSWQDPDADRFTGPWAVRTAKPALVVSTLYDPATPYFGAQAANRNLAGSRLLTLNGWGHAAAGQSRCIDNAVGAYLVNGTLPAAGARCNPDTPLFTSTPQPTSGDDAYRFRQATRMRGKSFMAAVALNGTSWGARRSPAFMSPAANR